METIVVISPQPYESALQERLAGLETLPMDGGVVVVESGSRIYISRNDEVADELSPERLGAMRARLGSPYFYTLDYSDIESVKRVLLVIADDPQLLIDNDHGLVLPAPDFLALIRNRPNWDWRHPERK